MLSLYIMSAAVWASSSTSKGGLVCKQGGSEATRQANGFGTAAHQPMVLQGSSQGAVCVAVLIPAANTATCSVTQLCGQVLTEARVYQEAALAQLKFIANVKTHCFQPALPCGCDLKLGPRFSSPAYICCTDHLGCLTPPPLQVLLLPAVTAQLDVLARCMLGDAR